MRKPPFAVLPSSALLLLLAGCQPKAEAPKATDPRVPVSLQPVVVKPRERFVEVVGTLAADESATIAAKTSGRIVAIAHDVGDTVAAGGELLRVDPTDPQLLLAQRQAACRAALAELGLTELPAGAFDPAQVPAVARAALEAHNAEARCRRGEAMFAEQPPLITEQERDDLRTAMATSQANHAAAVTAAHATLAVATLRTAELAVAKQALADTTVVAPTGGPWRVGRRLVAVGDYVREGTAVFELVDVDPIKFRADVPEHLAAKVQKGQRVVVSPASGGEVAGVVDRLAPIVEDRKRTCLVEILVTNADGALRPGGFARGLVAVGTDPKVVFVPQDAVVASLGQAKVFTVADGKAVEHKVTVGAHDGVLLELAAGDLPADAQVVTAGAARLATGVPVAVQAAPAGGGK